MATLMDLCTLLGKLLYVSQVCPPARLFLYRMLDTLRQCPEKVSFTLSPEFRKDLAWFDRFLPTMHGTFIIHQDDRNLVQLYIDACMSGCGALTAGRAYLASLQDTDDALSQYHLGPTYRDRVSSLIKDKGISFHPVRDHLFTLSDEG